MKERIARAKQGSERLLRPAAVQTCPHPNACLSWTDFLNDGRFARPDEQQRDETRRRLDCARENNDVRLVEVLERDEASSTNIIDGLDAIDGDDDFDGDEIDLLALADERSGEVA